MLFGVGCLLFPAYCKSAFSFDEFVSHRWAQLILEPSGQEMNKEHRMEAAKGKDGANLSFQSFNLIFNFFENLLYEDCVDVISALLSSL